MVARIRFPGAPDEPLDPADAALAEPPPLWSDWQTMCIIPGQPIPDVPVPAGYSPGPWEPFSHAMMIIPDERSKRGLSTVVSYGYRRRLFRVAAIVQ